MAHHDGTAHYPAGGIAALPRVFLPTWPPVGSNKAPFPPLQSNYALPPYQSVWGYWNTVIV